MNLQEVTNGIKAKASNAKTIGAAFKFVFEDGGVVHIDSNSQPAVVTNEDKPADCTLKMKYKTYEKILKGKTSPTMAVMFGKVKISGDMGLAMKLTHFL